MVVIQYIQHIIYHEWLMSLQWRASVSNHQPHDCLLNRLSCLFRLESKKTLKLRAIGLCTGNSKGTGEFPAQMASNAENVSIWWRHHVQAEIHVNVHLYTMTRIGGEQSSFLFLYQCETLFCSFLSFVLLFFWVTNWRSYIWLRQYQDAAILAWGSFMDICFS